MKAFLICSSQWRVAPMGGIFGLDYAGAAAALAAHGIDKRDVFGGLQAMERAAVAALRDG